METRSLMVRRTRTLPRTIIPEREPSSQFCIHRRLSIFGAFLQFQSSICRPFLGSSTPLQLRLRSYMSLLFSGVALLRPSILLITLLLLLSIPTTSAVPQNRTVDDAFGGDDQVRFSYKPQNVWTAASSCPSCPKADVHPTPASGTWHDTTQDTNIDKEPTFMDVDFVGTAIYIYCIIANDLPDKHIGTKANYSFFLDGQDTGEPFLHEKEENGVQFLYNILVHSSTSLSNTPHTLRVIPNGGAGTDGSVLLLFDQAIITVDNGTQAQPSLTQTQPIIRTTQIPGSTQTQASVFFSPSTFTSPSIQTPMHSTITSSLSQSTSPLRNPYPPSSASSSSSASHSRAIIGAAIGGTFALVFLILMGLFVVCRRQLAKERSVFGLNSSRGIGSWVLGTRSGFTTSGHAAANTTKIGNDANNYGLYGAQKPVHSSIVARYGSSKDRHDSMADLLDSSDDRVSVVSEAVLFEPNAMVAPHNSALLSGGPRLSTPGLLIPPKKLAPTARWVSQHPATREFLNPNEGSVSGSGNSAQAQQGSHGSSNSNSGQRISMISTQKAPTDASDVPTRSSRGRSKLHDMVKSLRDELAALKRQQREMLEMRGVGIGQ
ncbi:hypothetical protein C8J56DRAFT_969452 [Mycena floridula]|nr:hypothetical protein C8J56DRAFT_969452 [Mycena floridula]